MNSELLKMLMDLKMPIMILPSNFSEDEDGENALLASIKNSLGSKQERNETKIVPYAA